MSNTSRKRSTNFHDHQRAVALNKPRISKNTNSNNAQDNANVDAKILKTYLSVNSTSENNHRSKTILATNENPTTLAKKKKTTTTTVIKTLKMKLIDIEICFYFHFHYQP